MSIDVSDFDAKMTDPVIGHRAIWVGALGYRERELKQLDLHVTDPQ